MTEPWQEKCARRLTATLARKPRKKPTRDYLATLPKRPAIVVLPEDFVRAKAVATKVIECALAASNAAVFRSPIVSPFQRKDRRRPGAITTRWSCRPSGFRGLSAPSIGSRPIRDLDTVQTQRHRLRIAQGGYCGLCGRPLNDERSIDHVIPFASGGKDGFGNILLAHGECNGAKSDDYPTGCEMIWLLMVNAKLGVQPTRM